MYQNTRLLKDMTEATAYAIHRMETLEQAVRQIGFDQEEFKEASGRFFRLYLLHIEAPDDIRGRHRYGSGAIIDMGSGPS